MTHKAKNVEESDPLDDLLADYFDWIDCHGGGDVETFLRGRDGWTDPQLADRLREYLKTSDPIQALAAVTTASWIDGQASDLAKSAAVGRNANVAPARTLPVEFGDYELFEEIGRGGMGVVYKARHKPLGRIVCVKMILLGQSAGERDVERFRAEAKAMARLRHPNLVAVHEVGRHDGQDYFSMEYIPGRTLAEQARRQPFAPDEAARYLRSVAQAIHYAHEHQILHRDLKPANVLIDAFGQPRVTDFGLARNIDAGSLTGTGTLLGTPAYMAPEQTRGKLPALDVRADVYGLGATLYEVLTGRPPFQGETPLEVLLAVRQQDPPAPSLVNPAVPRDLETICLKCLEKDRSRRYESAAAVAEDLERFLRRQPVLARPISRPQRFVRWCRRNPVPFATGAVVLLSLIAATVVAVAAYRTTASALVDTRHARDEQARLAAQLLRERNAAESHLYLAQVQRAGQAIENGDLAEADELLREQVPQPHEIDRRGWEWHFLQGLVHQQESSLEGHDGPVHAVAWSPGGRQLASVGDDSKLRVWDAATARELRSIELRGTGAIDVAWSPDGEHLATAALDGTVHIRDSVSGKLLHDLREAAAPRALAWSPSGGRLAIACDNGDVVLSNASGAETERTLSGHTQRVNSVSWDRRGKWLATGSDDGTVRVWNPANGTCAVVLRPHADWVHSAAWSFDGSRLAAVTQDGTLVVWMVREDSEGGELVAEELYTRVTSQRRPVFGITWSHDDRFLITAGVSPRLLVWDARSGRQIHALHGHFATPSDVAWRPDRPQFASASADGTVKIWTMDSHLPGAPLAAAGPPVRRVVASPHGPWIAWRDVDGLVSVWDLHEKHQVLTFPESVLGATGLAWHPAGAQLALARESTVLVFSVPEGREILRLDGHQGPVWSIAWDPQGERIASGSNDRKLIVWNAESGEKLLASDGDEGDVRCVAWSHDGRRLATADTTGAIRIWDTNTGLPLRRLACDATSVNDLAWSPDGEWLLGASHEGAIHRWNARTGRVAGSLIGHQGDVWCVAWSQEGRRLFSCGQDGTIRIWDVTTNQQVLQLTGHEGAVWSLSILPDGRLFTSGVDGTVRVWHADSN